MDTYQAQIDELNARMDAFSDYSSIPLEFLNAIKFLIPQPIFATAKLAFTGIASGLSESLKISVPGAQVGDPVALSVPDASVGSGDVFYARVSESGVVKVTHVYAGAGSSGATPGICTVAVIKKAL